MFPQAKLSACSCTLHCITHTHVWFSCHQQQTKARVPLARPGPSLSGVSCCRASKQRKQHGIPRANAEVAVGWKHEQLAVQQPPTFQGALAYVKHDEAEALVDGCLPWPCSI